MLFCEYWDSLICHQNTKSSEQFLVETTGALACFWNAFVNFVVETVLSIMAVPHLKALMSLSRKKSGQLASSHGQNRESGIRHDYCFSDLGDWIFSSLGSQKLTSYSRRNNFENLPCLLFIVPFVISTYRYMRIFNIQWKLSFYFL